MRTSLSCESHSFPALLPLGQPGDLNGQRAHVLFVAHHQLVHLNGSAGVLVVGLAVVIGIRAANIVFPFSTSKYPESRILRYPCTRAFISRIGCYQSGLTIEKPNMSVEDFRWIAEQCQHKSNQFALGGRGDPDQHEHFEELLRKKRITILISQEHSSISWMRQTSFIWIGKLLKRDHLKQLSLILRKLSVLWMETSKKQRSSILMALRTKLDPACIWYLQIHAACGSCTEDLL